LTWGYNSSIEFDDSEKPSDPKIWIPYDWEKDIDVIAEQVKEKFGTLRFYHSVHFSAELLEKLAPYPKSSRAFQRNINARVGGMVLMAEAMSAITCEVTGKPGALHKRGGWLKVLCTEEAAKQQYVLAANL